ncbi:hypothetical protein G6011_08653 [Alternaria panax]|uniref:Uncharacterized protein n=1 Tax=Alternaria panax TaxID=48097 RepID=A0AAD4FJK7_9PLEO|nr:hypothetical protein G6011_08653 [Alternaria panax]
MESARKHGRPSNLDVHRGQPLLLMPMPELPHGSRPSYPDGAVPPYSLWQAIRILDNISELHDGASFSQELLCRHAFNNLATAERIRQALHKHHSVASIDYCVYTMANLVHVTSIHNYYSDTFCSAD